MDWIIEYTKEKIIDGWNQIEQIAPKIWKLIIKITEFIIKIIEK